jgi:hypothetical protein
VGATTRPPHAHFFHPHSRESRPRPQHTTPTPRKKAEKRVRVTPFVAGVVSTQHESLFLPSTTSQSFFSQASNKHISNCASSPLLALCACVFVVGCPRGGGTSEAGGRESWRLVCTRHGGGLVSQSRLGAACGAAAPADAPSPSQRKKQPLVTGVLPFLMPHCGRVCVCVCVCVFVLVSPL